MPIVGIDDHIAVVNFPQFSPAPSGFKDDLVKDFRVRTGSDYRDRGGQIRLIRWIFNHPQHVPDSHDYDFSILKLKTHLKFDEKCQAIKLPRSDEHIKDGTNLTVSGWGITMNSKESNVKLRALVVPKINDDVCRKIYMDVAKITPRMFCAGFKEGGKDSCRGITIIHTIKGITRLNFLKCLSCQFSEDSGGPLVKGKVLMGIVSWGEGCATRGHPGVYARVASVRKWIRLVTDL
uniref:Peptidase S1 domain-containing protein n=1 Tax=Phlebotomus papatasi TaxID=29031 RepID=A0A1B0GP37_PHLPP